MTVKSNNFEDGTLATAISAINSGGASGTPFSSVAGSSVYDNTQSMHGSLSAKLTPTASTSTQFNYSGLATSGLAARMYVYMTALATADTWILDFRANSVRAVTFHLNSAGHLRLDNAAGTTGIWTAANTFPLNQWVRIELYAVVGSTTTNGTIVGGYYLGDSTSPIEAIYSHTGTENAGAGVPFNLLEIAKCNSSNYATPFWVDDVAYDDAATGLLGPATTPLAPTAAFTDTTSALSASFDGSSSTANASGATITSYAWTFGDGGTGTGVTPTHTYATGGTYTVTLTVTDSNIQTNSIPHSVTVTAPATTVGPISINSSTGWTPTPGGTDALADITDSDGTTYLLTGNNPTNTLISVNLGPITPPTSGQGLTCTLDIDSITVTTSATVTAKLFEGATQRSSATGSISGGTSGSPVSAQSTLSFPATDIANVVSFNALTLTISVTAS